METMWHVKSLKNWVRLTVIDNTALRRTRFMLEGSPWAYCIGLSHGAELLTSQAEMRTNQICSLLGVIRLGTVA